MSALTFVDGVPMDQLVISDRGLAYGHGLFETIRVRRDVMPLWERHLNRLGSGAARLHIPLQSLLPRIKLWCDELLAAARQAPGNAWPGDGVLKLVVTAGSGERGYGLPVHPRPRVVLSLQPGFARSVPAVRLRVCATRLARQELLAGIKHLNRLEQVLARAEWRDDQWHEGIMLDSEGRLVECTSSNLFLRLKGRWYTPDLTFAGVAGVMRDLLREEVIPADGDQVMVDGNLTLDTVPLAEEVFICNAIMGIRPVVHIDGVGSWRPGAATARLQRHLARHHEYPEPGQ